MSDDNIDCLNNAISFNSKRCDYEFIVKNKVRQLDIVSIPKGAIMSGNRETIGDLVRAFQFQKVRL